MLRMLSLSKAGTLYTITCLLLTGLALGQVCNSATSCTECIKLSPNCVWCAQANYSQPGQRCVERMSSDANSCTMIEDPSGDATVVEARNFGGNDFVQISPHKFHLNLRPGEPQTVQVNIKPANNFPLDIYYLMDLSYSMHDDLQSLQNLASQIATTIRNITTNFQLGFGAFVDKEVVPFFSAEPLRLKNPCPSEGVCRPTFNTHHLLNLTNDTDQFINLIQAESVSGNLDLPEGGFDAFLQIIVCQEIVGWRQNARHFVVFLTDAGFHFAGDGKLGGVVIPYDGRCYLEPNNSVYMYTRSKELDYPSVGQLNYLLQQFDIIPIFAVEAKVQPFYDNLRSVITNAFVETLASDSSNILEIIQTAYYAISQTVRLDPDRVTGVTVDVIPSCPSGSSVDGDACTGLLIGQIATFNVTVTAQLCTQELIDGRNLSVKIPGFGEFVMELVGLCDCNCTNNPEVNSTYCNDRNGSLVCGQCICNEGWVGDTCECDASNISTISCPLGANNVSCTSAVRGICVCSTCVCNEIEGRGRYFGPACECDNFSCDKDHRGLVCGGTDQGMCGCDQSCTCLPGWSGMTCDCNLSTAPCVSPFGQICSERGTCVCGECICDGPEFSGAFCEVCTGNDCPEKPECLAFQECAICETFPNNLNCSDVNCTTERVDSVDTATYRIDGTLRTSFCRVTRGDCAYQYFVGTRGGTFTSEDTAIEVMEADCGVDEEGVESWIIIVSILGGLILLTIIVLAIIRIVIELRYYIEFRQWRKELEKSRFTKTDNPLYQGATEEFINPAYGK